jgi:hypothetical protein
MAGKINVAQPVAAPAAATAPSQQKPKKSGKPNP